MSTWVDNKLLESEVVRVGSNAVSSVANPTGTATRTTFATGTVTTEQLAQRVMALILDLKTAGVIK